MNKWTMEDYIQELVDGGYVDSKTFAPIKCYFCGSEKEFEMINKYYCPYGLEEYQLQCNDCGKIVGHWAFGNWFV